MKRGFFAASCAAGIRIFYKNQAYKLALIAALLGAAPQNSFAWGRKGHELVAEVAFHYMDDTTKSIVRKYLGMSIEDAANWMDNERSNQYYNYMRTWHYIDIEKGKEFVPSSEKSIVTVLYSAIQQLKKRDSLELGKKDIRYDLLLIFHLMGDLHQPLHVGYTEDKGGNTVEVKGPVSGNLHSVWDTDIIDYKKITLDSCLQWYNTFSEAELNVMKKVNINKWAKQSHSMMDTVYNFKEDGYLTDAYLDVAQEIIEKQILKGGVRLASVLNELFKPGKDENTAVADKSKQ